MCKKSRNASEASVKKRDWGILHQRADHQALTSERGEEQKQEGFEEENISMGHLESYICAHRAIASHKARN